MGRWRIVFPAERLGMLPCALGPRALAWAGGATDIGPGGGVIPPGFGEFEVLEPVRKQFVLVDTAALP